MYDRAIQINPNDCAHYHAKGKRFRFIFQELAFYI